MLCLAHNLAVQRTDALGLPVWRYRFDLVADNLNSRGTRIGTFHGEDIRFVMGTWRTIVLSPPFIPATPDEIKVSNIMVEAWTNFIKGLSKASRFLRRSRIVIECFTCNWVSCADPTLGPRISGWKQFDPRDPTTLALLGNSLIGAEPGNHFVTDSVCAYWNTLLPIFPQVSCLSDLSRCAAH